MKWLLVTTNPAPHLPDTKHPNGAGWNIGDVFARVGTEQVIREADPSAEFDLLNMDSHASITTERAFDRCVLAGRPLFWPGCQSHHLWTHVLRGWPGRDKRKLLALGVGDCYSLPRNEESLQTEIVHAKAACWRVTVRSAVHTDFALLSVCPATWSLVDRPERPKRKLCNFMLDGGHYPDLNAGEAGIWCNMRTQLAYDLGRCGFEFVAHSKEELDYARFLHWPASRIVYAETIEPYLDAYASASHYFGNRMHGAAILCGRKAKVLAVGFDSRLGMVTRAGGEARTPSQLSVADVVAFAKSHAGEREARRVEMIRGERGRMVKLMREFAA